jgi:3-oxoadipate enol-lactonase
MPTAQLNGIDLWYETAGTAGAPVLLIMGLGMPGAAWQGQMTGLSQRHRVAFYDHRGTGRSGPPRGLVSMPTMAADAIALLDHLGWQQAHIVGVSMGGMIAQELALRHRARVLSLSLIATHPGLHPAVLPTVRGLRLFARAVLARRGRLDTLGHLLFPPEYVASIGREGLKQLLRGDFGETPARTKLGHLLAVLRHGTERRLRHLADLPTMIIRPGRDVLVSPGAADRLHRLIPGSRLVRYDDAGHGVIRQCADRLNADLLAHFSVAP